MENIFKNKLSNYQETPPDFILKNFKNEIRGANSNFIALIKYFIAALIVAVAIISSIITFFNSTEKNSTKNKANNIAIVEKEQKEQKEPIEKTSLIIKKDSTKEKKLLNKETIVQDSETTKKQTIATTQKVIKTNAGNDVVVCGNIYKTLAKNTSKGFWFSNSDIVIADKNNPETKIYTKTFGVVYLIWKEKITDKYTSDTVKITFVNPPKLDIEIEQTNEVCANKNAEINFITNNNYNYTWNDGFNTNKKFRKNLSAGAYTITVSNTLCSNVLNVNISNKGNINADFYHTELYSTVNIPFYFTSKTEVENIENTQINYFWNFGDDKMSNIENPEHTYTKPGSYYVKLLTITNNGCKDSVITKIVVDEKKAKMPNIFTPNGDGKHDKLILNPKPLTNYYAVIFDRLGNEITHWNDVNIGWNGKRKSGDNASEGVYYYIVSGIDTEGKKFIYKSFVHLTR